MRSEKSVEDVRKLLAPFPTGYLDTLIMLEFYKISTTPQDLEFTPAIWRNDIPYELVIDPDTGHNIDRPRQRLESANRNLDWFNFWLGQASGDDLIE